jgi:hypothetical protein
VPFVPLVFKELYSHNLFIVLLVKLRKKVITQQNSNDEQSLKFDAKNTVCHSFCHFWISSLPGARSKLPTKSKFSFIFSAKKKLNMRFVGKFKRATESEDIRK